ncbi:MAG: hemerythrin family protein [Lachnospiraceae bacterium]|nr:hemerythrin family protein [Lachnospiraceae bacterium]
MYARFDESIMTGNNVIDGQHKELIEKINQLMRSCECGDGKVKAIKMLHYLADYADLHFEEEEKLQERINYPGLPEHRQKHEDFRVAVQELFEMLEEEEGPSERFVEAVNRNVIEWLYGHIKGFDCSVATYMHMNSIPDLL